MNRFCPKCGSSVYETARFCNQCGERLLPTQAAAPPRPAPQTSRLENIAPPPIIPAPATVAPPTELAPNIAGMLCYPLSIISGLIFLALRPYSQHKFIRFHAYQSVYFFFALLVLNLVLGIFSIFLPGTIESLLFSGLRLTGLGGSAWMMYQAYLGVQFKLPYIGDLAENQANKQ
ncbi:MAG: zinc-ribbon domain-containing protein [Acidobacteriota bacterium]